ncbi:MAG: hypothetical protein HZA24_05990 [Nitrospirae bacterium]|nr:hypothetical protein [Nitrospirota bacterium]
MARVITPGKLFDMPDGTRVAPVFNPFEPLSGATAPEPDADGRMSVALGELRAGRSSRIHVLPFVRQITWVLSGPVTMIVKGAADAAPQRLTLLAGQALETAPGDFMQLVNPDRQRPCRMLHACTPGYVFHTENGTLRYEDAVVFAEDWDALAAQNWHPPALADLDTLQKARDRAIERITAQARTV